MLQHALFVLYNLNADLLGHTAIFWHWTPEQKVRKCLIRWKDHLSGQWKGPEPLITSGRWYVCIFPQDAESPIYISDRLIWHVAIPRGPDASISRPKMKKGASHSSSMETPKKSSTDTRDSRRMSRRTSH